MERRPLRPAPFKRPIGRGTSLVVMRSPDGQDMPNHGVYLEVVKHERLIFTNAYTRA